MSRKCEDKKRRAYKEAGGGQAEKWEAGLDGAFCWGIVPGRGRIRGA